MRQNREFIFGPYAGLLLYLVLMYVRPEDLFPALASLRVAKIVVAVVLFGWLLRQLIGKNRFVRHPQNGVILALFAIMLITVPTAFWASHALESTKEFAKIIVFYFLAINLIDSVPKMKGFIATWLAAILWVSFVQIYTYHTVGVSKITGTGSYGIFNLSQLSPVGVTLSTHGIGAYSAGFLANACDLGVALLVALPFFFFALLDKKSFKLKLMCFLFLIILVVAIVYTGSRGAAVGLLAMSALIWLKAKRKIVGLIVLSAFLLGGWCFAPPQYKERIKSIKVEQIDESAEIRKSLWNAGIRMFSERPITGVGMGNFATAYGSTYREGGSANLWWSPHNIYIHIAAELGIFGFICFLLFVFIIFRDNKKVRQLLRKKGFHNSWSYYTSQALDVSLFGYLISGLFITVTYYPHVYQIAALSVALSQIVNRTSSEGRGKREVRIEKDEE